MNPSRPANTRKSNTINFELTDDDRADFDHIQQTLKDESGKAITQREVLTHLINVYKQMQIQQKAMTDNDLNLSETETQLVEDAMTMSRMSRKELTKRGLLKEARTALTIAEHQDNVSRASFEDLKDSKFSFKGVAQKRIELVVSRMMAYNDTLNDKKDKFYLTETFIASVSGSNRPAIKKYFTNEVNDEIIRSHNQNNKFDSMKDANHNRNLKLTVEQIRHKINLTAHSVDVESETSE